VGCRDCSVSLYNTVRDWEGRKKEQLQKTQHHNKEAREKELSEGKPWLTLTLFCLLTQNGAKKVANKTKNLVRYTGTLTVATPSDPVEC